MSLIDLFIKKASSNAKTFRFFINFYPPFLFSGIRIKTVSPDFRFVKVKLNLSWYNRNYVGTQFGGNLFSMTDPFYMIMLMKNLGENYIVWDKYACIDFIKPGESAVFAEFQLLDRDIEGIKGDIEKNGKALPEFEIRIKDNRDETVAIVKKVLFVRKKR